MILQSWLGEFSTGDRWSTCTPYQCFQEEKHLNFRYLQSPDMYLQKLWRYLLLKLNKGIMWREKMIFFWLHRYVVYSGLSLSCFDLYMTIQLERAKRQAPKNGSTPHFQEKNAQELTFVNSACFVMNRTFSLITDITAIFSHEKQEHQNFLTFSNSK